MKVLAFLVAALLLFGCTVNLGTPDNLVNVGGQKGGAEQPASAQPPQPVQPDSGNAAVAKAEADAAKAIAEAEKARAEAEKAKAEAMKAQADADAVRTAAEAAAAQAADEAAAEAAAVDEAVSEPTEDAAEPDASETPAEPPPTGTIVPYNPWASDFLKKPFLINPQLFAPGNPAPSYSVPADLTPSLFEVDGLVYSAIYGTANWDALLEAAQSPSKQDTPPAEVVVYPDAAEYADWFKTALNGAPDRRNAALIKLNSDREQIDRLCFQGTWPSKWLGPGIKGEALVEVYFITYNGIEHCG